MAGLFETGSYMDLQLTDVGPQIDGSYNLPVTAQPVNNPSNTAGYPAASDSSALDILKYGVGVATDAWKFNTMIDYKRFEATNGGIYQQGRNANVVRNASGSLSPGFLLAAAGIVVLLVLAKG